MGYTITLVAGIITFIVAVFAFQRSLRFIRTTSRATAEVIEMVRVSGSDGDTFKPVFKFKTALGREVIYRSSSSSSPPSWKVGETTTVAYREEDPNDVKVLTYFGAFGFSMILFALAMPMLVIGGGYYWVQRFLQ